MKIYAVTDGSYEDYHTEAIFTDKNKAKQYAALHNLDNVEEWEVDAPETLEELRNKVEDGTETHVIYKFMAIDKLNDVEGVGHNYSIYERVGVEKGCFGDVNIYVTLDNEDYYKAEEIARQMYAQWKENKQ